MTSTTKYFCAIDNCGMAISRKHRSDHKFVHHDILYPGRQGRRIIITPNSKRRFKDEKKKIDEECRAKRKLLIDRYQPPTSVSDYQHSTSVSDYEPTNDTDFQPTNDIDFQPTNDIDFQPTNDTDFQPTNNIDHHCQVIDNIEPMTAGELDDFLNGLGEEEEASANTGDLKTLTNTNDLQTSTNTGDLQTSTNTIQYPTIDFDDIFNDNQNYDYIVDNVF